MDAREAIAEIEYCQEFERFIDHLKTAELVRHITLDLRERKEIALNVLLQEIEHVQRIAHEQ